MDSIITALLWIAIIAIPIGLMVVTKRILVSIPWVFASILFLIVYLILLRESSAAALQISGFASDLNWVGKIAAGVFTILAALLITKYSASNSLAEMGFTFRQSAGSIVPAILVTALAVAFTIALELLVKRDGATGNSLSALGLFYKGVFHGLDEELFFRGVWLATLALALKAPAKKLLGAPLTVAGLVMTLIYALMHGLNIYDGSLIFSPKGIVLVGIYGVIYLWLRQRTGSLVMPFVAHTLCNLAALLT